MPKPERRLPSQPPELPTGANWEEFNQALLAQTHEQGAGPGLEQLRQRRLEELRIQAEQQVGREIEGLWFISKKALLIQIESRFDRLELAGVESQLHQLGGQGCLNPDSFGQAYLAYQCYSQQYTANRRDYQSRKAACRLRGPEFPAAYNQIDGISRVPVAFRDFLLYGVPTLDFQLTRWGVKAQPHEKSRRLITNSTSMLRNRHYYGDNGLPQSLQVSCSTTVPISELSRFERLRQEQDLSHSPLISHRRPDASTSPDSRSGLVNIGFYNLGDLDPNHPAAKATLLGAAKFISDEKKRFEELARLATRFPKHLWRDPRFLPAGA